MDCDTMISALEANGHLSVPLNFIGDMLDIDRRVKQGDESGWRGDPSMGLFLNPENGNFEVWGVDARGKAYLAASHHKMDHTLLIKLREGDWRKHDVIQRVLDNNASLEATAKAKARDEFEALADKMQWAIRRDFAQHLGGRGGIHAVPGRKET
jgi:hypothetical protein